MIVRFVNTCRFKDLMMLDRLEYQANKQRPQPQENSQDPINSDSDTHGAKQHLLEHIP